MPGKSGNPGGRPKKTVLSDAYRAVLEREVPDDPKGRTFAGLIADQMVLDEVKGRNKVSAAAELTDRTERKAKESHQFGWQRSDGSDVAKSSKGSRNKGQGARWQSRNAKRPHLPLQAVERKYAHGLPKSDVWRGAKSDGTVDKR